jgi:hypothetical protein
MKDPSKPRLNGSAETPVVPSGTSPGAVASALVFAGVLPAVVAGAGVLVPVPTSTLSKVTLPRPATWSSCTISERTSSSAGAALPRLTSLA